MKVLLVNGSPRKAGCTYTALQEVAGALQKNGVETEIFQLGTAPVHGCTACGWCKREQKGRCVFDDDVANRLGEAAKAADGLVVGSPVYYAGPNGALCAVLDRVFYSGSAALRHKPAACVVSCRRAGSTAALDRLEKYFSLNNMPIVTSKYWNMVHGNSPQEVAQDLEGLQVMRQLGENMAWLLQNLSGKAKPGFEPPVATNFIR